MGSIMALSVPAIPGNIVGSSVVSTTNSSSPYFDSSCETDPGNDNDGDSLTNLEECLIGTLPGALIGYALGLFLGQYWETPDWQQATKATLGGLAGYGLSAVIQFGGGLIILIIFLITIL